MNSFTFVCIVKRSNFSASCGSGIGSGTGRFNNDPTLTLTKIFFLANFGVYCCQLLLNCRNLVNNITGYVWREIPQITVLAVTLTEQHRDTQQIDKLIGII